MYLQSSIINTTTPELNHTSNTDSQNNFLVSIFLCFVKMKLTGLTLFLSAAACSHTFMLEHATVCAKSGLTELIDAQPDQRFAIYLEIGKEGNTAESHSPVSGMLINLLQTKATVVKAVTTSPSKCPPLLRQPTSPRPY